MSRRALLGRSAAVCGATSDRGTVSHTCAGVWSMTGDGWRRSRPQAERSQLLDLADAGTLIGDLCLSPPWGVEYPAAMVHRTACQPPCGPSPCPCA